MQRPSRIPSLAQTKSKQSHSEYSASHSIPKPLGRASESHMARRDLESRATRHLGGSDWALAAHSTRPMVQAIVRGSACYTHSYSISSCSELVDFHVRFRVALRRLMLKVIINMCACVLRSHVLKTAVAHHWHAMSTHSTIRSP